jgi:hypothetical protein
LWKDLGGQWCAFNLQDRDSNRIHLVVSSNYSHTTIK